MAIVFLGTPAFAVPSLRRLVAEGFEITAVYTQPDRPAGRGRHPAPPPVKAAALELGLPVRQPESLRDPDVLAVPAAILAGDAETGVTIILMDAGMDSGPVLAQRCVPIQDSDTTGTLMAGLADVAAGLLAETLPSWLRGEIQPQPQDDSQATKAPLLKKEQGAIDWSLPAVETWRRVRAYNPWPGAYTTIEGALLHVWEAWPLADGGGAAPGTVVTLTPEQRARLPEGADPEAFGVTTGDGILALLVAQREGRRALPAGEFLRGMRDFIGRRLGT